MKPPVMLAVIVVAAGLGVLAGLGGATVLAALPAMFCLIAAFGGTLYADLRLLGWFGPVLVLVLGGLAALASITRWPAIALLTLIVLLAGLLPVLGSRYFTVGLGLGMAATFAYGFQQSGPSTLVNDFAAPALSVAVVLLARLLMGLADPDEPLRTALAGALTSEAAQARDQALQLWQADRPRVWTTRVLGGILRYRNAVWVLTSRRGLLAGPAATELDRVLADGRAQAGRVAEAISARSGAVPVEPVRRTEPRMRLPGATQELLTSMWLGLEAAQSASAERDRARMELRTSLGRERLRTSLRGGLSWSSVQLRHAIRCALGMLVALSVSLLWAGDPLRLSFLMAVFAIMQPQLRDTVQKARQRVIGALAGATALAVLVLLVQLPRPTLVPIGVVALLVGFLFFMQTRPIVFNACVVLMSVGMNVEVRHLEPWHVLIEYVLLMVLAVVIGLVFGFVAVPGVPKPSLSRRFDEAVGNARELLRAVAAALVNHDLDGRPLVARFRAASAAQQNLRAVDVVGPEPAAAQLRAAEQASEALQGLSASASALMMRARASIPLAAAVGELAHQLDPLVPPDPARVNDRLPAVIDVEQRLLLDSMLAGTLAVSEAAATLR